MGKLEDKLIGEHDKEVTRKKAKFYNMGWGASKHAIASKTDKGVLCSSINPKTKKVTHEWSR
jgi:hypothetical protein